MDATKQDHLDPNRGPKRILALDGGGVRGMLTLQFLQALETLVTARFGERTRLCDYFDLIGGTSTGSIIAAGLACGMTVGEAAPLPSWRCSHHAIKPVITLNAVIATLSNRARGISSDKAIR